MARASLGSSDSSSRAASSKEGGVASTPGGERDLTAQEVYTSPLEGVEPADLSCSEEGESVVQRARFELGLRRRQCPLRTARRLGCQAGGALEEGGGRGQPAPRLSPAGRPLELGGNTLIGGARGLSEVPGAPVGVDLRVGRFRQRPVHPPALLRRCPAVDRRADQRMAKPHPVVDFDQAGRLRWLERGARDPEPLGRAPQEPLVTDRLSRRYQQELLTSVPRGPPAALGSSARSDPTATAPPATRTRPPAARP